MSFNHYHSPIVSLEFNYSFMLFHLTRNFQVLKSRQIPPSYVFCLYFLCSADGILSVSMLGFVLVKASPIATFSAKFSFSSLMDEMKPKVTLTMREQRQIKRKHTTLTF